MNYCRIARESLLYWLQYNAVIPMNKRSGRRAGCFVSLHAPDGQLRGCVGTIAPVQNDLVQEIIENAIAAGTRDTRFCAIALEELPLLNVEVSVLAEPVPILSEHDLDPLRYGVIVENGFRRGVLLPNLVGIESPYRQIEIAKSKAFIGPEESVQLWRFEVEKFHEQGH